MRYLALLCLVGSIVLLAGCSKDAATEPEETGDPADDYTEIVSGTIGAEGGTLQGGGLVLGVPAGALSGNSEFKVLTSTSDNPFEGVGDSTCYRIDGIPLDYSVPLRLAIRYEGTLARSGEGFIALGQQAVAPGTGEMITGYTVLSAVDSSGYLVCEIAPPEQDTTTEKNGRARFFNSSDLPASASMNAQVLADVSRHLSAADKFRLTNCGGPATQDASISLLNALEEVHDGFGFVGMDLSGIRTWPVEVTVKDLGDAPFGRFVPDWRGVKYGSMEFNTRLISEADSLEPVCARELARFFQNYYEKRNIYARAWGSEPEHLWWNEAFALWMEERAGAAEGLQYGNSRRKGREMAPFKGLHKDAGEGARLHGYGMTPLISYFQLFETVTLKDIYLRLRQGDHIAEALTTGFRPPSDWLPSFYSLLVKSFFAPQFTAEDAVDNAHGEFKIQSANDVSKTFSRDYPDLSAALYKVKLDYPGIDPGAVVSFRTSGRTANISVFQYDPLGEYDLDMELISSFVDEAVIEDVKQLTDDGLDLLAVVTNSRAVEPYTDTTPIDLTVEVLDQPEYRACYIAVDLTAVIRYTAGEESHDVESSVRRYASVEGLFSGRTFTGDLYETTGSTETEATIMVTLDESFNNVESFSVSWSERGFYTHEWSAEGGGVPLEYRQSNEMRFAAYRSSTCDAVTSYAITDVSYSETGILQSYNCDDGGGEVEIIFWPELP